MFAFSPKVFYKFNEDGKTVYNGRLNSYVVGFKKLMSPSLTFIYAKSQHIDNFNRMVTAYHGGIICPSTEEEKVAWQRIYSLLTNLNTNQLN